MNSSHTISWNLRDIILGLFGLLYLLIGVLNIIWVSLTVGLLYIVLASLFFPPIQWFLKAIIGERWTFYSCLGIAVVVLWGTLGVGDLAELAGL